MNEPDDKPDFLRSRAFRECGVVFFVAVLLGLVLFLTMLAESKKHIRKINCVNNLKQAGLALNLFAGDNNGQFPMKFSTNSGGTKEWVGNCEVYRHFLVASNELGSPKVLLCPQDSLRLPATSFASFNNQNLSYWIELDTKETFATTLLAGDRNLSTNRIPLTNGCFQIATQQVMAWNNLTHDQVGNVAITDGSVRRTTAKSLHQIRAQQQIVTNWLAIP